MSKRKCGWERKKESEEKRNREDALLQSVVQLDTFFTMKQTPNCIDALDREGMPSSPTEHTITEHTSRSSPRFDSDYHSHDPLNLHTTISTLSVLEADLVNLDLTNEAVLIPDNGQNLSLKN